MTDISLQGVPFSQLIKNSLIWFCRSSLIVCDAKRTLRETNDKKLLVDGREVNTDRL